MPSAQQQESSQRAPGRLLLISNRLPITLSRHEDGKYSYHMSDGGLVAGLSGLSKTTTFEWYGWPGQEIPEDEIDKVSLELQDKYNAHPIFIDDDLADKHYNGFANSTLWPLFHYHPGEISFDDDTWEAYRQVNRLMAQAVARDVRDGDAVWVHDYHLMLFPEMLREELGERGRDTKIGFFLHTPFPSSEIYRVLPVRRPLLRGLLRCDLVGFHTYDYCRHFLSSCARMLSAKTTDSTVEYEGKTVRVGAFPIGIEPHKFTEGLTRETVRQRMAALRQKFDGVKLIVGVDRLDYIKGVPQKLFAFEEFLARHPEWVGRVVLVQVAIPSRQNVEEYQNLRADVNEIVGRINGRFGTVDFMPIHFLHKTVDFEELTSLYAVSDVCFVSSTRDGMNLVSYEYVAAQRENHGVLIMSEFTGAVQGLGSGSLVVNPWDTEQMARAIYDAVTMPREQRDAKYAKLERFVFKYTSAWWGSSFLPELTGQRGQPV